MSLNIDSNMYFKQIMSRLFNGGNRIKVPKDFPGQTQRINELLENDYTGIVSTIVEFMVTTGSVPMNFVTDNEKLTKTLQDWSIHKLNADIHLDIPKGLKALTAQYLRERYRSSFIILNILWEKIGGLILPSKMWFLDGSAVIVDGSDDSLNGKKYFLGDDETPIKSTEKQTIIIRKPFNSWYDDYPTPYLVKKGVLYNAMLKRALISKQSDVIEELIPYILMMRAGDANLMLKGAMGDIQKQLSDVKDSLKEAKRNKKYQHDSGDMIMKARYDVSLEHLIPDLTKLFNSSIIQPINYDLLAGLGLIELQGFSSSRQETILNPKMMVEEILRGINDFKALMEEVTDLIIEKNAELHPKHMGQDIRIVPGVAKAFLTDNMTKLIKDYTNTGIVSIEDAFEGLPQGFDFAVSKKRRQQEADNGDEDLFFPRVILNQDSNTTSDTAPRTPTPNEIPKKPTKKVVKAEEEYIEAPYSNNSELPSSVKDALPDHAQTIFRSAWMSAFKDGKSEEVCFKIAWAAVKAAGYKKNKDGKWVKKEANEGTENE
jgi:cation transport regulator